MRDQTLISLVQLLPRSALSTAAGAAARAPLPAGVHRLATRAFARAFGVDLGEAELPLEQYRTLAEFFTRRLRSGARPIDPDPRAVVSPVDGTVSEGGAIEAGECLQAKGIRYSLERLLDEPEEARAFDGGAFATLYLSPRDYHRIHAPVSGGIEGYTYIPGDIWPVSPRLVRSKEALFCLNERLATYFSTGLGRVALVAVGATCVGRIRAAYDEVVTRDGQIRARRRYGSPLPINKGDELATFEMGSTVILLFQRGRVAWAPELAKGAAVRVGRRIGAQS
ncbi:MAG: phosphatidylserine decarboxylase [Myxococcales bacterium]|nr:phosphatidylserine decarboxylase [Myxococcales bacterium]